VTLFYKVKAFESIQIYQMRKTQALSILDRKQGQGAAWIAPARERGERPLAGDGNPI
jgi:hypothetical protein